MTKAQKKRTEAIRKMVIYCTCAMNGRTQIFRLDDDFIRPQLARRFIEIVEAEKLEAKGK